ncbi:MAG: PqqD family protein [Candidatus Omnitrophica bacterium]|nr:PqqD family protein [Candidatus Omnitrophota bacterium]MDD5552944.1 PqqD family protein [Candidatus Omnitrophota bacterium]
MAVYRKRNIPWRIIDGEALVVDPEKSLIYPFNAVAARVWQLIDGAKDTDEIAEMIFREFEAEKALIHADITDFIAQLKESELIEAR